MSDIALTLCIFATAILYSSVGYAGASGYMAAMVFFNIAPGVVRPSVLVLNLLVAAIATYTFTKAGQFSWRTFLPIAITSVPMAFIGGSLSISDHSYRLIVGTLMIVAAVRMAWKLPNENKRELSVPLALVWGAAIGLLSGITGMGGSILLGPVLLMMGWTTVKESFGVCAAFNLVNSIAGFAGIATHTVHFPEMLPYWAMAAVLGAIIGSDLGLRRIGTKAVTRIAAALLLVAGIRMAHK